MSNKSLKTNMNLNLELVEISDVLKGYIAENDKFKFPKLADAYLEISRVIYKTLLDYHPKWRELVIGHSDLLKIIQCMHQKETDPSGNEKEDNPGRISVRDNRDHVIRSMVFYVTEMQNLRENKHKTIITYISYLAIIFSFVSLVVTILPF